MCVCVCVCVCVCELGFLYVFSKNEKSDHYWSVGLNELFTDEIS